MICARFDGVVSDISVSGAPKQNGASNALIKGWRHYPALIRDTRRKQTA